MQKFIVDNEKETAWLEAFSDGIFGVAITLLALLSKLALRNTKAPTMKTFGREFYIIGPNISPISIRLQQCY